MTLDRSVWTPTSGLPFSGEKRYYRRSGQGLDSAESGYIVATEKATANSDESPTSAQLWLNAFAIFYFSSVLVALGFSFGFNVVKRGPGAVRDGQDSIDAVTSADGVWYKHIAEEGYFYDPERRSNVAYFPAYPLLARLTAWVTRVPTGYALLIVSNTCFFAAIVTAMLYLSARRANLSRIEADAAVLTLALFPTSCFFRLACSESLFLLCCVVMLYAMAHRWPVVSVAAIAGLATATRPVGVAALAPLTVYIWSRGGTLVQRLRRFVLFLPLGCSGLVAFMIYQQWAFGDALAFAKTQRHWQVCAPMELAPKLLALAELAPLRSVYDPASPAFWKQRDPHAEAWFSLHFANPVFFLVAACTIALATYRRWLSKAEVALAVMLLLIPYLTRGQEMGMASMGRFVAVVFPLFPSLAKIVVPFPPVVRCSLAALSAFFLAAYSALFAAGYRIY